MTLNIEREKAKRKIIALLNKTVDKGASEYEAMNAAEKASELMGFYDIECGELEFQEKNIVKTIVPHKSYARREYICSAAMGIAKLCQVRYWRNGSSESTVFFGFKHDTDIAEAMFLYLEATAMRETEDFEQSEDCAAMLEQGYNKKSVIMSFIKGFDSRMYVRLSEMVREREQKVILSTGTSLVAVKDIEIDRELKAQGVKLVSRAASRVSAGSAYHAGRAAAERASINTQVNGGSASRRIA